MCTNNGTPCFISGPHIGVTSDIDIFRQNPPPLVAGECLLGDKAYVDKRLYLTFSLHLSIKKLPKKQLTSEEYAYNRIHAWYRASIEHIFGFMKRFKIISTVFRGRVSNTHTLLADAVKIIAHVSAMYLMDQPHRVFDRDHVPFPRPTRLRPAPPAKEKKVRAARAQEKEEMEEEEEEEEEEEDSDDEESVVEDAEGAWNDIDTGNIFQSFEGTDYVMAWYDNDFYLASITETDEFPSQFSACESFV